MTCAKRLNSLEKQCPMRAVDHDWSGGSMDLKKAQRSVWLIAGNSWTLSVAVTGRDGEALQESIVSF